MNDLIETATYTLLGKGFELLTEMPNIPDHKSGLSRYVYFSNKFVNGTEAQHGPRIKVSKTRGKFDPKNTFSVAVSLNPTVTSGSADGVSNAELEDIYDWVRKNHDDLVKTWHGALELHEFKKNQKKL